MFKDTLLKYIKELELSDWDISADIGDTTHVKINDKLKKAFIYISKSDLPYKDYWILHELYHIKFPHKSEEQINKLTSRYLQI